MALGFWDIPGAFSVGGEFAGLGHAKVLDRRHPPKRPKPGSKRGASAVIFWGWWDLVFAEVLTKMGRRTWFFGGEVVVDCW